MLQRWWALSGLLILAFLASSWLLSAASGAASGWVDTAPLPAWDPKMVATYPGAKLGNFTATTLPDGRVLALGGFLVRPGAIYTPATNVWAETMPPPRTHYRHTATLLANGQVLVVGGWEPCCTRALGSNQAERFDPVSNGWIVVAPLAEPRANHTATLLTDGTVLVVGGDWRSASPSNPQARTYTTVERYDPATDHWASAAPMSVARANHTATRLPDGTVLVIGSDGGGTAERYDPATNTWTAAGKLQTPRSNHTATLLHDGTVLVVGGGQGNASLATVERYDPAKNTWAIAAPLAVARYGHSATLLNDGTLAVAGSKHDNATTEASVEGFDPATNAWTALPALNRARTSHGAALIGGELLVVGGETASANPTAEWFDPGTPGVCFAETGRCVRGPFLDRWTAYGGLALNGYPLSDEFAERLEDGKIYRVQYFERVRLEYHPEHASPNDVLLGQFGRRIHPADPPLPPPSGPTLADRVYFAETGHSVIRAFFNYWYANGGLTQFGYPLTEEFDEVLQDGKTYRVQYFERARFEHHPENAAPYDILLGQFGRQIWGGR